MDEHINITKTGLFYSPPKLKFTPTEGRGRANTSGSDSSITELIIPEEDSDLRIPEQPEGKYSNKDSRHASRHKHRRQERAFKGGEFKHLGLKSCAVMSFFLCVQCCWCNVKSVEVAAFSCCQQVVLSTCKQAFRWAYRRHVSP